MKRFAKWLLLLVVTLGVMMVLWPLIGHEPPPAPTITAQLKLSTQTVAPLGKFSAQLTLSKTGVNLAQLVIDDQFRSSMTKSTKPFTVTTQQLDQLNSGQPITLTAQYQLVGGAMGSCDSLKATLKATAAQEVIVSADIGKGTDLTKQVLSRQYCLPQPTTTYTYQVLADGQTQSDLTEFINLSAQTLSSSLGWGRAGVGFKRVETGADFTLVLAAASELPTYSSVCDSTYSCQVGRYVIINEARWRLATSSWNNAGGSLRDYRHMVVNHETGHWLGFRDLYVCPVVGKLAPIMLQQSINLRGCAFNPWPTSAEITTLEDWL
ncbi:DUF3152 domain-containing protein [Candidatus Microgenomates bacterium]|nr:DUF3152 domain-containing protein [Candidatus Microgenomates bacterium]